MVPGGLRLFRDEGLCGLFGEMCKIVSPRVPA